MNEGWVGILGGLTGLLLGTLGAGGTALAQPTFLYVANLPVKSATVTGLITVCIICLIGAIQSYYLCQKEGCLEQKADLRIAALMIFGGMIGAFVGAKIGNLLPDKVQLLLFALIIVIAATSLLRKPTISSTSSPETLEKQSSSKVLMVLLGAIIGVLTGVVGIGGGFLLVPVMTTFANLPIKQASATSLWIIAVNSFVGVLGYTTAEVPIGWQPGLMFLGIGMIGMFLGQRIAHHIPAHHLRIIFALFLIILGGFTVLKTAF